MKHSTGLVAMTINSEAVVPTGSFDVTDPATGAPFAAAPECTEEQLDAAMQSAADAFDRWRRDETARKELLLASADAVLAATEELAPLLTREQGKPLADAQMEVRSVALWLRYFADLQVDDEILQDDDRATSVSSVDRSAWWQRSLRGTSLLASPPGRLLRRCERATRWCSNRRRTPRLRRCSSVAS